MIAQFKNFKVLGISRDFNQCECCGKSDLTKTVAILDVNSGVTCYFGTTCAASIDKYDTLEAAKMAKKDIQAEIRKFDDKDKQAGVFATGSLRREMKANGIIVDQDSQSFKDAYKVRKAEILAKWELEEKNKIERIEFLKNNPEAAAKESEEIKKMWDSIRNKVAA